MEHLWSQADLIEGGLRRPVHGRRVHAKEARWECCTQRSIDGEGRVHSCSVELAPLSVKRRPQRQLAATACIRASLRIVHASGVRYLAPQQAQRLYDRIGRLQDTQSFYERPAQEALLHAGRFAEAQAVLEFGCGTGRFAALTLARLSPQANYHGIDSSETMVRLSRHRLRRYGARATVGHSDGSMRLPFPEASFDRFVSTYVLDLLSHNDAQELLAEARRVLEPGGRLCLASFTHGSSGLARPLTNALGWLAARRPELTGGCRPIELLDLLPATQWRIEQRHVLTRYAIPSELIVAVPGPTAA
jgi:SAM-dependent methyltransferase